MKKLFSKLHSKHKKGFTLLEMLVVVVIIGVLTAVAVPTYNRVMRQSRVADGLNMLDVLASAQNKYYIQHGQYTDTLSDLNAPIRKSSINQEDRILTTNFEYSKGALRTCVYAESKDGEYIIAKNYKTNARPLCKGNDCANFSSLVETGDIDELCPKGDDVCNKTEAWCISQGYTGIDLKECKCTGVQCNKDLEFCLSQLCTGFNPTACQCTGCPNPVCKDGDERWVALAGKTCSPVIQGSTERDRGCGRTNMKQKCSGGVWVNTDETTCSNQWLIDQCGSESNVNWSPKCDCKKDIVCKYKGADYNVGQSVYTGYEDDTDGSCKAGGSSSLNLGTTRTGGRKTSSTSFSTKTRCYMKHLKKECQKDATWQDEFDCVDKATICSLNGQVLDENCNCVDPEPEPTSCDSKPKPACDGQITGGENPCGRGSSTSSGSGSASQYVPCEFLCGYNQQVAYCDEESGNWNGCNTELKTYNPNVPKTQSCQGEGTEGSTCGKRSLISVSCELQTPYSALNFNVTENYGECTLPEGSCWEGEERTNPDTNIPERCIGCTWVAQGCNPNATLPQVNVGACQMKGQECQKGSDGAYSWQYTNTVVFQPGAQCVTGQSEACTIRPDGPTPRELVDPNNPGGGNNGGNDPIPGIRYCNNCHWGECVTCTDPAPAAPAAQDCIVQNNGQYYCGTKYSSSFYCEGNEWIPYFSSNAPCENLVEHPEPNPVNYYSSGNCFYRRKQYSCNEPSQWDYSWLTWTATATDNNCTPNGDVGGQVPEGQFCINCKKMKCPNGSVYNSAMGKCYKPKDYNQHYYAKFKYKKNSVYPGGSCEYDNAIVYCQYGPGSTSSSSCQNYGQNCSAVDFVVLLYNGTPLEHCAQTTNPNKLFMRFSAYMSSTNHTVDPQTCQSFKFCEYEHAHPVMQCEEQDMVLA